MKVGENPLEPFAKLKVRGAKVEAKIDRQLQIRLKLMKIGAVVTVSVRRIKLAFASACPVREVFTLAHDRLRRLPTAIVA